MSAQTSNYHRRVAEQKRTAIVGAATALFLESGYDRTSLAKVADLAGVSKATLFKQFPTKAALFEAIVAESWNTDGTTEIHPAPGDLRKGLTSIGHGYVELLTRPGMTDLFRIVIAEVPRFPELGQTQFDLGKMPYFNSVRRYLDAEREAGAAELDDAELAATQFLGMISNYVFWPRLLLVHWSPDDNTVTRVVDEAVAMMVSRYGRDAPPDPRGR
ncbi:TetR/AcrR family transcriptional regulator [Rhodococcus wratislaviensis]|uniref:Putative TetR family transcriptional regulator n=1 Tax=Rhodococcus wratislaviensis NBRC 100605 TaxID=1219028 RepID=X0Q8A7_RHOWR|nr:TetR/AcrR family transcriptional regulator [Rhodococcus wratislaviensis]GAF47727.1 putative TetR family transcriptional regulator [Rhodococcus wratislaviensis NBRC 100605]